MNKLINGLHHVTALAGDPQHNLDFYTGVLGLRMVKKTVNFDASSVYHLYYGDEAGAPATIMTFFPFKNIVSGSRGTGQLTTTSFSISSDAVGYWTDRFKKFNVNFNGPEKRLNEEVIILYDADGLELELVANDQDQRAGWKNGVIKDGMEIKGFHSVTLLLSRLEPTAALLTEVMEHRQVAEENNRFRFSAEKVLPGNFIDVVVDREHIRGIEGGGTVHHVAFSTDSEASQLEFRDRLTAAGHPHVTPVLDRQYFKSIYFREPGGVLFEVATNPPGFHVDEPVSSLGSDLKLPEWLEPRRSAIAAGLQEITVPDVFK